MWLRMFAEIRIKLPMQRGLRLPRSYMIVVDPDE